MITKEQVREALQRHSGKVAVIDDCGDKVEWREGFVCNVCIDFQAVADELNAELGSDRESMTERVERFCGEYADLLERAEGLDPLSGAFGKLEGEEMRMIDDLVDSLLALVSGTCENIAPKYLDFLCSECGFVHYHSDENDSGDGNDWAFCPQCGKAVKR